MARWDYHVRGGESFVGLTDAQLDDVRQRHSHGRAVESVHHLPRVAGDDETDHIMRHRYGVDPASYRGVYTPRASQPQASRFKASKPRVSKARTRQPRASKAPSPRVSLSRLVQLALSESPDLAVQIERIVRAHLRSGKTVTQHSFIGLRLEARSLKSLHQAVRLSFESER